MLCGLAIVSQNPSDHEPVTGKEIESCRRLLGVEKLDRFDGDFGRWAQQLRQAEGNQ